MDDIITKEKLEERLEFYLRECQNAKIPQLTDQLMATIESLCKHYKRQFPDVAEKYRKLLEEEKKGASQYQN